jgi:hypothetical protein
MILSSPRGNEHQAGTVFPLMLGNIPYDEIRHFENLEAAPFAIETDADLIGWICAMAAESPTSRALLHGAEKPGWSVRFDATSQNGYDIDRAARGIVIDHHGFSANALARSGYYRNILLLTFIKALRAVWHEDEGHYFLRTHRPDAALMLARARAADIEAVSILAAWELRAAGHADIWRALLGSEEGDMAMIFTRALESDASGFYDGSVLTRCFCQWYGDQSRIAMTDHATLEEMDGLLKKEGADIVGQEPLRARDIENLSRLPAGKPYLAGMGKNLCTDPYFMALEDPINESHLFQISYDSRAVMVEGVPFRDARLARLIFPDLSKAETRQNLPLRD